MPENTTKIETSRALRHRQLVNITRATMYDNAEVNPVSVTLIEVWKRPLLNIHQHSKGLL